MGKAKKAPKKKAKKKKKKKKVAKKKKAAAMKKSGKGLFKVVTLAPALAAVCGKNKMTRPEAVKAIWVYIKKKGLSKGRNVGAIPGVFSGGSMFKLPAAMGKLIK